MTEFLSDGEIASAIQATRPTQVAVAYLGADWNRFLPDIMRVEQIVLAPVLGTNPYAVTDLLQAYRQADIDPWTRVHFLDNLHAKLYLGEHSAVFGSANLSTNGLSGQGLKELCALTDAAGDVQHLELFFLDVLERAKAQYSSAAAKKRQLAKLLEDVARNPSFAGGQAPHKAVAFEDFDLLAPDQFYVSWYRNVESVEYTDESLARSVKDFLLLAPDDEVEPHKWVLCWECDEDKRPRKNAYWLMIDEVLPEAVRLVDSKPTTYTKLAIERESTHAAKRRLQVPFALTPEVRKALFSVLRNDSLRKHLTSDKLSEMQTALPDLVERMRHNLDSSW
jgi:hypothetical protein